MGALLTQDTLAALGVSGAEAIAKGLKDPDRRFGLILEAVVDAYAADPSQAVTLLDFDQGEIVLSDAWPLPPDAARRASTPATRGIVAPWPTDASGCGGSATRLSASAPSR